MAKFREVNKAIKLMFPSLDIEAVKGNGYVYFDGKDGFDKIESLYGANPATTDTETMIRLVLEQITDYTENI